MTIIAPILTPSDAWAQGRTRAVVATMALVAMSAKTSERVLRPPSATARTERLVLTPGRVAQIVLRVFGPVQSRPGLAGSPAHESWPRTRAGWRRFHCCNWTMSHETSAIASQPLRLHFLVDGTKWPISKGDTFRRVGTTAASPGRCRRRPATRTSGRQSRPAGAGTRTRCPPGSRGCSWRPSAGREGSSPGPTARAAASHIGPVHHGPLGTTAEEPPDGSDPLSPVNALA
jgi:hypothetical protein